MNPESFQQAGDLTRVLVGQMLPQGLVGEALDDKFTVQQEAEQRGVLLTEEIKALVATVMVVASFGQVLEFFDAVVGRLNVGDELQITLVDGLQDFG